MFCIVSRALDLEALYETTLDEYTIMKSSSVPKDYQEDRMSSMHVISITQRFLITMEWCYFPKTFAVFCIFISRDLLDIESRGVNV